MKGLDAGHRFNCGVVYLPPAAARDGVAELIRVNPELRKIFIVTEKLAVHDSREIRAMGQPTGIDIFGGTVLAWPTRGTRCGSAARWAATTRTRRCAKARSPSSPTPATSHDDRATYLRMAGWGTTTSISSGKDVYIHFAAPEFAFALANDARSKAAVLYCRTWRLLRTRRHLHQAGGRLRGRALEEPG